MKYILIVFFWIISSFAWAATVTAVASGSWQTNATWDCTCQPVSGDDIIIPFGFVVGVNFFTQVDLRGAGTTTITIQNGGVLDFAFSSIRIDGGDGDVVNVESGGQILTIGAIYFDGEFSPSVPIIGSNVNGPATIENGTLPIELISFEGELLDDVVNLEWVTGSEENFSHFEIEHSYDGEYYLRLADIEQVGQIDTVRTYHFQHKSPLIGHNYYRLKSVDLDGTYEYSYAIHINRQSNDRAMSIYPNPVIDEFTVQLNFVPLRKGTIQIFDSRGEIIYVSEFESFRKKIVLQDGFNEGIYFVRLITDEYVHTRRIIAK